MRPGFEKLVLCKQSTAQSQPMNIHSNARLTLRSRAALVESILQQHLTAKTAASAFGVSERTARKWLARYRAGGTAALADRSCAPHQRPNKTPSAQVAVVLSLRRLRLPGFQIARQCALSRATVSRILRVHNLHRLALLDPPV